jgi:acyl-coenzyme A thioesterase PaaI-like protein
MSLPKTHKAVVDYLFQNFKKGQSLLAGSRPGFCHALKLSHQTMDPQRVISIGDDDSSSNLNNHNKKLWSYRYQLSPHVPKYTVGLLTALMDELSTDACFRVGLPSPPGVSLQMQTEVVSKAKALDHFMNNDTRGGEVDIINSVTKLGKSIAHTRTDFRCATTQELIAFSSHVKYMPTGSRLMDILFRNSLIYEWYLWWMLDPTKIPMYEEKALLEDVLLSNLKYHDAPPLSSTSTNKNDNGNPAPPLASFTVTTEHTNPFGSLHGGCHAMIMEQVAISYAHQNSAMFNPHNNNSNNDNILLEAMQVEYLSAGQPGLVDVSCETIDSDDENGIIHVRVFIRQQTNGRLCSEGKLRLSVY